MSAKKRIDKEKVKPGTPMLKERVFRHFSLGTWYALVVCVFGFLLYANTIRNQYVLDDAAVITGNPYVMEGIKGIPKIFTIDVWHFSNVNLGYYRPLSMMTFAIENQFFPSNPHISHFTNVVLFAVTGFFLCLLLTRLFKGYNPGFALIVSLLFMAHPIHTEVVANIKSRDEILSFLNLIISLYLLLKAVQVNVAHKGKSRSSYLLFGLSGIFFYLSLLSKETAAIGIVLFPVAVFFSSNLTLKKIVAVTIPYAVLTLLFLFQKYEMLGRISDSFLSDIVIYPYLEQEHRVPSMFLIFGWCLKLLAWPYPLSCNYAYNQIPPVGWTSIKAITAFLLACLMAVIALKNISKKHPVNFGLLILGITLAPAMGFVLFRGGILAERMLYAPALGFCILLVLLLDRFTGESLQDRATAFSGILKSQNLTFSLLFILSAYSFETVARNTDWYDNLTLFGHDVRVTEESCQIHVHYANALADAAVTEKNTQRKKSLTDSAMAEFHRSINLWHNNSEAFFGIGYVYQNLLGKYDSALYYYNISLMIAKRTITYDCMGFVYDTLGKPELASYYFNKAIEANPYDVKAINYHQNHVKKTGLDVKEFPTQFALDTAEINTPESAKNGYFYAKMGVIYANKGDFNNALRCLQKATVLDPVSTEVKLNLAICYAMLLNYDKALLILNNLLASDTNNIRVLSALVTTYYRMGLADKAHVYNAKIMALSAKK